MKSVVGIKQRSRRLDPQQYEGDEAWRGLWPQLAFGLLLGGTLAITAPGALPWAAPTLLACGLAIPFTCSTAGERLGRWMVRRRLCAIPDEYDEAPILQRVRTLARPAD